MNNQPLTGYQVPQPTPYTPPTPQVAGKETNTKLTDFKNLMRDYAELDRLMKELKAKQEVIKEEVREGLESLGLDTAKTDDGTFSMVKSTVKKTFDAKAFEADAPKLYALYLKESKTKGYLKVTLKKKKDVS